MKNVVSVGPKKHYKEALKISLKGFNIPTESIFLIGNRLHRIEQSGVASSIMQQLSKKQRESVKLKESAKSAK